MLLFSFPTLFLVLSQVMAQDSVAFHEEPAQPSGQAVPESRKTDTARTKRSNKCYSFPCFYYKEKHLARKPHHFDIFHQMSPAP